MTMFQTIEAVITDDKWLACGPDKDERSVLALQLRILRGSSSGGFIDATDLYLEAYAVHDGAGHDGSDQCDICEDTDFDRDTGTVVAARGETAFERLAESHEVPARVQTMTIAGRLYALFAEPAGA